MKPYMKFAAQVVATVLTALVAGLLDDRIDVEEWINVGIVGLGAISVLGAGNLPSGIWSYTKTLVSAATAGLVLLTSLLADGVISGAEWLQVLIAVAGAAGVAVVPGPRVYDAVAVGRHAAALSNGPA